MRVLLAPRYWPAWLGFGLLWLWQWLPYRLLMASGGWLGGLLRRVLKSRARIAMRNIQLCFPELDPAQHLALHRECFRSVGRMIPEAGLAWFAPRRRLAPMVRLEGFEQLDRAAAEGQGVLLLAPHFTTLEMGGRLICLHPAMRKAGLYREHGNPVLQWMVTARRGRYTDAMFSREETRGAVRYLRSGGLLWYAPDQDYERGKSLFAPFFGISAATSTSAADLARLGRARVLILTQQRLPHGAGYRIGISDPLEGYPGDDPQADCARINGLMEAAIRTAPDQYLWLHRRFKNRPPGEPGIY